VLALRAKSRDGFISLRSIQVDRGQWRGHNQRIVFSESIGASAIIDKVASASQTIGDVFDVRTGLQAYEQGKGNPPQSAKDVADHIFDRDKREDEHSVKYLQGKDVARYELNWSGMWMQYGTWLSQPREFGIFSRPRVLLREITSDFPLCLNATYVTGDFLNNKSILNILHPTDDENEIKKVTGILNSRLMSLFYKQRAVKSARKIFPKVVIKNLREFPYPKSIDKAKGSQIVQLIDQMLALHKQSTVAQLEHEQTSLRRQISATDRQIDRLVYEIYGLTEEEVKIAQEV